MPKKKLKIISLEAMIDKHPGKVGTPKRDAFDYKLHIGLSRTVAKPKCQGRKQKPATLQ